MAQKKSEMLSGWCKSQEVFAALVNAVRDFDAENVDELLREFKDDPVLLAEVGRLVAKKVSVAQPVEMVTVPDIRPPRPYWRYCLRKSV